MLWLLSEYRTYILNSSISTRLSCWCHQVFYPVFLLSIYAYRHPPYRYSKHFHKSMFIYAALHRVLKDKLKVWCHALRFISTLQRGRICMLEVHSCIVWCQSIRYEGNKEFKFRNSKCTIRCIFYESQCLQGFK